MHWSVERGEVIEHLSASAGCGVGVERAGIVDQGQADERCQHTRIGGADAERDACRAGVGDGGSGQADILPPRSVVDRVGLDARPHLPASFQLRPCGRQRRVVGDGVGSDLRRGEQEASEIGAQTVEEADADGRLRGILERQRRRLAVTGGRAGRRTSEPEET